MAMHLWWWRYGEDHSPGESAEDAIARYAAASGEALDDCGDPDEWVMVPDDEYMHDEDGSIPIPAETATQFAERMAENWQRRESR